MILEFTAKKHAGRRQETHLLPTVKRSARVPHTPEQMFDLVNDVESYPKFLHWCRGARVDLKQGNTVEATLEIGVLGFQQSFRTRNTLQRPERIGIDLVSGPFRRLRGEWRFSRRAGRRNGYLVDLVVRGHGVAIRNRLRKDVRRARGVADDGVRRARDEGLRREHLMATVVRASTSRLQLEIALDARDAVVLEVDDEPALDGVGRAAAPKVIGVVPAIAVKAVGDHRCAEQELNLAARHADVDLGDVLVVEQVALLDVDAIDASREGESRKNDQWGRNLMQHRGRGGAPAELTS